MSRSADILSESSDKTVFIAHNRDGLGERLRALTNSMVMAKITGQSFRFAWPELREPLRAVHAITPAEEFFSAEFLEAYLIEDEVLADLRMVPLREAAAKMPPGAWEAAGQNISVSQPHLTVQARSFVSSLPIAETFSAAFNKIGLSDQLAATRQLASTIKFPKNAAAVHLRAGDVVYGTYRTMDDFHGKVISFPIAMALIENLKEKGTTPILFGQDNNLLDYLGRRYDAICASNLGDRSNFTAAQNALFDILLLAQCHEIYAGSSGFAVLGSWLANTELENPSKSFDSESVLEIVENCLFNDELPEDISNHQRAFAARTAFVLTNQTIAKDDRMWRLLRHSRDCDPENDFIQFVYACSLHHAAEHEEAEEVLRYLFDRKPAERGRLMAILKNVSPRDGVRASPYLDDLCLHARKGFPMAALCCAISYSALEHPDADKVLELYFEYSDSRSQGFPGHVVPVSKTSTSSNKQ